MEREEQTVAIVARYLFVQCFLGSTGKAVHLKPFIGPYSLLGKAKRVRQKATSNIHVGNGQYPLWKAAIPRSRLPHPGGLCGSPRAETLCGGPGF